MNEYPLRPWPEAVEEVRAALPADAREVYLVGGAVRDWLLGRPLYDVDLLVPRGALALARTLANRLGAAFYPLDAERGFGRLVWESPRGRVFIDLAPYRGASLEDDLRARDFTVNAMAVPLYGELRLIDPTGGLRDLREKVLRACSERAFEDDPLRVLRAVRLSALLGFRIEPHTAKLMRRAAPLLPKVSAERTTAELFRIMSLPRPTAPLKALAELGALAHVLPELDAARGVPHLPTPNEDLWLHSLHTAERLVSLLEALHPEYDQEKAADFALGFAMVRIGRYRDRLAEHLRAGSRPDRPLRALLVLAALYHDLGKAAEGEKQGSDEHARRGAQIAAERGRSLRLSADEISRWKTITRYHLLPMNFTLGGRPPTGGEIYRFYRRTRDAGVDIVLISLANMLALYGASLPHSLWQAHLETARALLEGWWERRDEVVDPPVLLDGNTAMQELGLKPSPLLGELLEAVRTAQAEGLIATKDEAIAYARRWLDERV